MRKAKIVPRKPVTPPAPAVAAQASFETAAAEARGIIADTYGKEYADFYCAMRAREALVLSLRDAEHISYAEQHIFYSK